VVLPRSAFAARDCEKLRQELFANGTVIDLTFLLNRGGWVFDAEHRYTIALASLAKGSNGNREVPLRGPFANYGGYANGIKREPLRFSTGEVFHGRTRRRCRSFPMTSRVRSSRRHEKRRDSI
jgi:hypothetical protein